MQRVLIATGLGLLVLMASGGLGLLATSAALAAPRPSIASLKDARGKITTKFAIGEFVQVVGSDLHVCATAPEGTDPSKFRCQHEDLSLRVAGKPVTPTGWTPSSVTFNVPPHLEPGHYRIEVTLRRRGSVSTRFEVVKERRQDSDEGGQTDEETRARQSISITRFEFVQQPAGAIFEVEGKAVGIPDGLEVALTLRYAKTSLLTTTARIRGEAFRATFGPYTKRLPYGPYQLDLLFEIGKQSKSKVRRWRKTLSRVAEEVYGRLQRVQHTTVGTPAERAKQKERLARSIDALLKALDAQLLAFQEAYADAGRSLFKEKGRAGYDQAAWERWLTKQGLTLDPAKPQFATQGGHFQTREFERWAEKEWIPGLKPAIEGFRALNATTVIASDPQAERIGEELAGFVLEGFRSGVERLYGHSELKSPLVLSKLPETRRKPENRDQRTYDSLRARLIGLKN